MHAAIELSVDDGGPAIATVRRGRQGDDRNEQRVQRAATTPTDRPDQPLSVPVLLRVCVHLLVVALLALVAFRAPHPAVWAVAVLVGVLYLVGNLTPAIRASRPAARWWLVLLLLSWTALLILSRDAGYLAFAWFFLIAHLLPLRPAAVVIGVVTVVSVAGLAYHQGFGLGVVIGPVIGAGVVIATAWGYTMLQAESERRRELLARLQEASESLATAQRTAGAMAERERLAREIHDTLSQGLSSIQLLLRAAQRSLSDGAAAPAADYVEQARAAAQDNLAEARRFVRALSPPDLQAGSLVAALHRLADRTEGMNGLSVVFEVQGSVPPVPTGVEVAILRIAQSAVANVVQHAGATRLTLTLTGMDSSVTLDVVDDGAGFDPAEPTSSRGGGFGLPAMRSRIAEWGGEMTVESAPGTGTALAVSFPVAAA